MAGNRPNKLEAVKQWRKGFLNDGQLSSGQIFELALQSCKELHKVLGLCMGLLEVSILSFEEFHAPAISSSAALILYLFYNLYNLNLMLSIGEKFKLIKKFLVCYHLP